MKKLLALSLILILALPAALADGETDPIVGAWYAWMVTADGPENEAYADYTYMFMMFVFEPDGRLRYIESDFTENDGVTLGPVTGGRWSVQEDNYHVQYLGLGEGTAYLNGDRMFYPVADGMYYVLHRATPLIWWAEILPDFRVQRMIQK